MSDFRVLLEAAAARFPSKQAFARAIGITPSRFSRLLRGDYSMEVINCLRLAKVSGESATKVLEAAGKSDVAALIEELYGTVQLTREQREWLTALEALPAEMRPATLDLLASAVAVVAPPPVRESSAERAIESRSRARGGRRAGHRR